MGRGEEAVFLTWRLLQSLPPVLGLLEFGSNFSQTGTIVWTWNASLPPQAAYGCGVCHSDRNPTKTNRNFRISSDLIRKMRRDGWPSQSTETPICRETVSSEVACTSHALKKLGWRTAESNNFSCTLSISLSGSFYFYTKDYDVESVLFNWFIAKQIRGIEALLGQVWLCVEASPTIKPWTRLNAPFFLQQNEFRAVVGAVGSLAVLLLWVCLISESGSLCCGRHVYIPASRNEGGTEHEGEHQKLLPCSAICILSYEAEIVFFTLGNDVPTQTRHQSVTCQLDAYWISIHHNSNFLLFIFPDFPWMLIVADSSVMFRDASIPGN